jgi:hypothetical protein
MKNMKSIWGSVAVLTVSAVFASCAQPTKLAAPEKASPVGSRFDGVGKVTLHAGQPCTSQIMFDFRTTNSNTVWLAAAMAETKILTEAASRHHRVHISGKWRRGKQTGCSYVDVTKVDSWK